MPLGAAFRDHAARGQREMAKGGRPRKGPLARCEYLSKTSISA